MLFSKHNIASFDTVSCLLLETTFFIICNLKNDLPSASVTSNVILMLIIDSVRYNDLPLSVYRLTMPIKFAFVLKAPIYVCPIPFWSDSVCNSLYLQLVKTSPDSSIKMMWQSMDHWFITFWLKLTQLCFLSNLNHPIWPQQIFLILEMRIHFERMMTEDINESVRTFVIVYWTAFIHMMLLKWV